MYTDDIDEYTARKEKELEEQPECEECGEHIQDEYCFEIPFYGCICQKCLKEYRKWLI